MKGWRILAAWAVAAIASGLPARGQAPAGAGDGAVAGVGVATIKRAPEAMRVQVQLSGEGKTVKDALAKLGERRDAAKKKLAEIGAPEASIQVDEPRTDAGNPQAQMEAMMRARMRASAGGNRPPAPGAGAAPPVKVSATLKAEFPLAGKSPEELLVVAHETQEKVKAADLSGAKVASLEEQERREEAAGMDGEDGPAPGEPAFTFVARIPEQERAAATADAFKKARANASELAKAAGAELGALKQLHSQAAPDMEQFQQYGGYRYQQMMMMGGDGAQGDPGEAVGMRPTSVSMKVTVSASFGLK